jgi:hypothetical protein
MGISDASVLTAPDWVEHQHLPSELLYVLTEIDSRDAMTYAGAASKRRGLDLLGFESDGADSIAYVVNYDGKMCALTANLDGVYGGHMGLFYHGARANSDTNINDAGEVSRFLSGIQQTFSEHMPGTPRAIVHVGQEADYKTTMETLGIKVTKLSEDYL